MADDGMGVLFAAGLVVLAGYAVEKAGGIDAVFNEIKSALHVGPTATASLSAAPAPAGASLTIAAARGICDAAIKTWCTGSTCNQNGNVNCNAINDATVLAIAQASQAQGGGWPSGVRHCKTTQGEGLYAWGGGLEYAAHRAIAPGDCYS